MRRLFLLICLLCSAVLSHSDDEMPVIAYIGVPGWRNVDEEFKTFSECGFTVSLNTYTSLDTLLKACDYAEKYGVRIIGGCQEMFDEPQRAANALKDKKGFYGYLLKDEPSLLEIREMNEEMQRLKTVDSTHTFYVNLFPNYYPEWIEPSQTAKSYPEYVHALAQTPCRQLSFDYYPVTSAGIRSTWYNNLEMIRKVSIETGKPFWAFVLSMPHDVPSTPDTYYPQPNIGSLRLQVYSNLAYGAQAIQYFTYWTPGDVQGLHFHDAPISPEGQKTNTYWLVQRMNRELKPVAKLFYGARVLSVGHLGTIPDGTKAVTEAPLNISRLEIVGKPGAVVSQFEKDGHRYLAIVNKNHKGSMKVLIKKKNNIPRYVTKLLRERSMKSSYTVPAGDIVMFRLK